MSQNQAPATAVILMGVSGAGKTTIGQLLAAELGWAFVDADDLHPEANVRKMASGQSLDDADRLPWLRAVRRAIEEHLERGQSLALACSALKATYREILTGEPPACRCVYLRGDRELIASRLRARRDHFMPPGLLDSQFATLEEPSPDTWTIDIDATPAEIVQRIHSKLESTKS